MVFFKIIFLVFAVALVQGEVPSVEHMLELTHRCGLLFQSLQTEHRNSYLVVDNIQQILQEAADVRRAIMNSCEAVHVELSKLHSQWEVTAHRIHAAAAGDSLKHQAAHAEHAKTQRDLAAQMNELRHQVTQCNTMSQSMASAEPLLDALRSRLDAASDL